MPRLNAEYLTSIGVGVTRKGDKYTITPGPGRAPEQTAAERFDNLPKAKKWDLTKIMDRPDKAEAAKAKTISKQQAKSHAPAIARPSQSEAVLKAQVDKLTAELEAIKSGETAMQLARKAEAERIQRMMMDSTLGVRRR